MLSISGRVWKVTATRLMAISWQRGKESLLTETIWFWIFLRFLVSCCFEKRNQSVFKKQNETVAVESQDEACAAARNDT